MCYKLIKNLTEEEYTLLKKRIEACRQRFSDREEGLRAALRSMCIHPIEIERVVGLLYAPNAE
jgi:hypothetical protein